VTIPFVIEPLGTGPTTAALLVERLAALGVVGEITGRRRDRVFREAPVTAAFADPDVVAADRHVGENAPVASAAEASNPSAWEQAVVARLFERSSAQRIIVFGSVARGESAAESDLDLVVVTPVRGRKHDEAVSLLGAVSDLPVAVDVVVVTPEEFPTEARLPGIVRVAVREGRSYERAA
jgi:predicted nucleotidyltransferase